MLQTPLQRIHKAGPWLLAIVMLAQSSAQSPANSTNAPAPMRMANLRQQRASRDLHGAKRYMDRSHIAEAQNVLEEDDDKRGTQRLA